MENKIEQVLSTIIMLIFYVKKYCTRYYPLNRNHAQLKGAPED